MQASWELLNNRDLYDGGDETLFLLSPTSFCGLQKEISIVIIFHLLNLHNVFFIHYVIGPSELLIFIIPMKKLKFDDVNILRHSHMMQDSE